MRAMKLTLATLLVACVAVVLSVTGAFAGSSMPKVMICGANPTWNMDVKARLDATGRFSEVGVFDCGSAAPTNARIARYDAVLVIDSSMSFSDPQQLGDKLAAYADAGGRVVEAAFDFNPAETLGGRWSRDGYGAFVLGSGAATSNGPRQYVEDMPTSPLLDALGTFKGGPVNYHLNVAVASDAVLVAHWADDPSTPLEADGPHSIGLNFMPPPADGHDGFWDESSDGTTLLANALDPPAVQDANVGISDVAVCTTKPVLRVADDSWGMFADIDAALWSAGKHDPASPFFGSRPAIEVQGYGLMCDLSEIVPLGGHPSDFVATGTIDGYYPVFAHR